MNAVEIEEAVSELALQPFDADEFPFDFLLAFGNPEATIKRLRKGATNKSDVGGVLQRNNIHITVAEEGELDARLAELRGSPQTAKAKAKFILVTDGKHVAAEELGSGEPLACDFEKLGHNFGFFLPLAGISTVAEIKNNPIDVRATGRLNKLYVELLKIDPDWATAEKRPHLNRFMARLIFCFFAEDTGIFNGEDLFTNTVRTMTEADGTNTHEVLEELFRAMNLDGRKGERGSIKSWANVFPFVNGGLFKDEIECPTFNRTARAYLIRAGELDWKTINPDIFGSMIQAVADDDERGSLGMHYTSVPNIEKVLNPLFLDDLRRQLEEAGPNKRKLLNLRKRLASIRVFDPACGSGNFLVIAYIRLREIEAELMQRRGEALTRSWVQLTQFYGIELKSFAAEIARLSLLIAEFQSDVRFIGQTEARSLVLPLHETGKVVVGNALLVNWYDVCPPTTARSYISTELFNDTPQQLDIDFENIPTETFICGNPPYKGSQDQSAEQKAELEASFGGAVNSTKSLDYVSGWFFKGRKYVEEHDAELALVTTNSIHQGRQVATLWPVVLSETVEISFACPSFRWSNLASNKAVVTVSVIGLARRSSREKRIYDGGLVSSAQSIGPYLVPNHATVVTKSNKPLNGLDSLEFGNMPNDGGALIIERSDFGEAAANIGEDADLIRPFIGTDELINGKPRYCLWIDESNVERAQANEWVAKRLAACANKRAASTRATTRALAATPHRFGEVRQKSSSKTLIVSGVSSEKRRFLPAGYLSSGTIVSNLAYFMPDAPLWCFSLAVSRVHLVWVATVCGKLETRYRYSNTLGWNTFPIPRLTAQIRQDLCASAERILLAREQDFPDTLADVYDPENMPVALQKAHEENDLILERAYIGRAFRNDTERLEKLFELYSRMMEKK